MVVRIKCTSDNNILKLISILGRFDKVKLTPSFQFQEMEMEKHYRGHHQYVPQHWTPVLLELLIIVAVVGLLCLVISRNKPVEMTTRNGRGRGGIETGTSYFDSWSSGGGSGRGGDYRYKKLN